MQYRPLADEIRPQTLEDVVGQSHILGKNGVLRRIIESGQVPNMVFFGPSGTGKTTVANIIANQTHRTLHRLNATTASIADIREVIADVDTLLAPNGVLLYLDEIQYFNKKQQQSLLEFMENGKITVIASTTENPYFTIFNAVLSRSTVFEFKPVTPQEIRPAVDRAFRLLEERSGVTIQASDAVRDYLATACGGDVRKAINGAELLYTAGEQVDGVVTVTLEDAELVGTLQEFLDQWMQTHSGRIDYVHGDDVTWELGRKPGNIGFLLPAMGKDELFKTVIFDGALPRKTFSMGEAHDKRFYLEARKIK